MPTPTAPTPTPADLGLSPEIFPSFREGQDSTATALVLSPARVPLLNAPCGSGKSLMCVSAGLLFDLRTLIITPQTALQDQYVNDFGDNSGSRVPMADVRGQSHYDCPNYRNCEIGAANDCPLRRLVDSRRCSNLKAIDHARKSKLVVTNNYFWMTQGKAIAQSGLTESAPPPGIGSFDLVVIDEGHSASEKLAEFCSISLFEREINNLVGVDTPPGRELRTWSEWARNTYAKLPALIKSADSPKNRMRLIAISRDLIDLSSADSDKSTSWIYQYEDDTRKHTFSPLWASARAESLLFQGAQKVVVTSATLLTNTGEYLGVAAHETEYLDIANTFSAANRPLIYSPSGVKLGWKSTESDIRVITSRYDQIVDLWKGYNGLWHTQSHKLTQSMYNASRNKDRIVVYGKGEASDAIRMLKENPNRGILVMGPGLKEGFDLKGEAARFQLIGKMPFIDQSNPVVKARCESNPRYFMDQASVQLMQMVGRIVRDKSDWGYSYTSDAQFMWMNKDGRFPQSFRDSIRVERNTIPGPPREKG